MSLDPRSIPATAEERRVAREGEMRRRTAALERAPKVAFGAGPPSGTPARIGALHVDTTNSRLYVHMGGGTWKFAALT